MTVFGPFYNSYVSFNNANISPNIKSVTIRTDVDLLDTSGMGNLWQTNTPGKKRWQASLTAKDEFGNNYVDVLLWDLTTGSNAVAFAMRPDAANAAVTNPQYSGNVFSASYEVGGAHGAELIKSFVLTGTGELARNTS